MTSCKIILFIISFFLFSAELRAENFITNTYTENYENFPNPERGLYAMRTVDQINSGDISYLRSEGITLVLMKAIPPNPYTNYNLSSIFLNNIQSAFDKIRDNGLKAIFRFVYYESFDKDDPSLSTVLHHIEQLGSIFSNNKDVINHLEAGFIGPWGEWHSSSLANTSNERTILYKLLDNSPIELMVCVRTPMAKRNIFTNFQSPVGYDTIDLATAFSGLKFTRVGFHNDCFVSSCNDVGTYPSCTSRQEYMEYIGRETRYAPFGGESCDDEDLDDVSHCDNSLYELELMHASYLHDNYSQYILDRWNDEGCLEEIKRRLGYRFVLKQIIFSDTVQPGGVFILKVHMTNVGFAAPFHERPMFLHFKNGNSDYTVKLKIDSRFWLPGKTIFFEKQIRLQSDILAGNYSIYFSFPDEHSSLSNNANYSIRLANNDIWDSATGYNFLGEVQVVLPAILGYTVSEDISGFVYGVDMSDQFLEFLEPDGVSDTSYSNFTIFFKILSKSNQKFTLYYIDSLNTTYTLKEYINPINGYYSYNWDTSNLSVGTYYIGGSMITKTGFLVNYVDPSPVYVSFKTEIDYNIYPNPVDFSKNILRFDYKTDINADVEFYVYNLMGEFVIRITKKEGYIWEGNNEDGKQIEQGIYIVKMKVNGKAQKKFIKLAVIK